ncbi:MAG: hypothetical protein IJO76_04260 [Clostridia bacterium]|nr:hypothetical protein [Clostridia bacterium]
MFFLGLVLIIFGGFCVLMPDAIYQFSESWKSSSEGEPSAAYLLSCRIGGVIAVIVGIMAFFV